MRKIKELKRARAAQMIKRVASNLAFKSQEIVSK